MQQKIKLDILDKLINHNVTSTEINLMIYLSHYQNDHGYVLGVYYKDVCKSIQSTPQTYYESLKSLEKKGLIIISKNHYGDCNIIIVDNDFSYPGAYQEGYINTGHNLFYDNKFYKLKAKEKLIAMYILKVAGAGRGSYHIGTEKLYLKFAKLFGVTKRAIQNYLTSLKAFFTIGVKNQNYWITPLKKVFKSEDTPHEHDIDIYAYHIAQTVCRRNRIKILTTDSNFKDTALLIKQYASDFRNKITETFILSVEKSLQIKNQGIKNTYHWKRILQPNFIHKLLMEELSH